MTVNLCSHPWSIVSVYSAYTPPPEIHVMLIETSETRYLPGPEWLPTEEGTILMKCLAVIAKFIAGRSEIETSFVGYNWSPRSWGKEEDQCGFQSLPLKLHWMVWGWPPLAKLDNTYMRVIDIATLSAEQRKILDSEVAREFANFILDRLEKKMSLQFFEIFKRNKWKADGRGVYLDSEQPLSWLLNKKDIFSLVIKPIAFLGIGPKINRIQ